MRMLVDIHHNDKTRVSGKAFCVLCAARLTRLVPDAFLQICKKIQKFNLFFLFVFFCCLVFFLFLFFCFFLFVWLFFCFVFLFSQSTRDFGGQMEFYITHQMFLIDSNAFFVIAIDLRDSKDEQHSALQEFLKFINTMTPRLFVFFLVSFRINISHKTKQWKTQTNKQNKQNRSKGTSDSLWNSSWRSTKEWGQFQHRFNQKQDLELGKRFWNSFGDSESCDCWLSQITITWFGRTAPRDETMSWQGFGECTTNPWYLWKSDFSSFAFFGQTKEVVECQWTSAFRLHRSPLKSTSRVDWHHNRLLQSSSECVNHKTTNSQIDKQTNVNEWTNFVFCCVWLAKKKTQVPSSFGTCYLASRLKKIKFWETPFLLIQLGLAVMFLVNLWLVFVEIQKMEQDLSLIWVKSWNHQRSQVNKSRAWSFLFFNNLVFVLLFHHQSHKINQIKYFWWVATFFSLFLVFFPCFCNHTNSVFCFFEFVFIFLIDLNLFVWFCQNKTTTTTTQQHRRRQSDWCEHWGAKSNNNHWRDCVVVPCTSWSEETRRFDAKCDSGSRFLQSSRTSCECQKQQVGTIYNWNTATDSVQDPSSVSSRRSLERRCCSWQPEWCEIYCWAEWFWKFDWCDYFCDCWSSSEAWSSTGWNFRKGAVNVGIDFCFAFLFVFCIGDFVFHFFCSLTDWLFFFCFFFVACLLLNFSHTGCQDRERWEQHRNCWRSIESQRFVGWESWKRNSWVQSGRTEPTQHKSSTCDCTLHEWWENSNARKCNWRVWTFVWRSTQIFKSVFSQITVSETRKNTFSGFLLTDPHCPREPERETVLRRLSGPGLLFFFHKSKIQHQRHNKTKSADQQGTVLWEFLSSLVSLSPNKQVASFGKIGEGNPLGLVLSNSFKRSDQIKVTVHHAGSVKVVLVPQSDARRFVTEGLWHPSGLEQEGVQFLTDNYSASRPEFELGVVSFCFFLLDRFPIFFFFFCVVPSHLDWLIFFCLFLCFPIPQQPARGVDITKAFILKQDEDQLMAIFVPKPRFDGMNKDHVFRDIPNKTSSFVLALEFSHNGDFAHIQSQEISWTQKGHCLFVCWKLQEDLSDSIKMFLFVVGVLCSRRSKGNQLVFPSLTGFASCLLFGLFLFGFLFCFWVVVAKKTKSFCRKNKKSLHFVVCLQETETKKEKIWENCHVWDSNPTKLKERNSCEIVTLLLKFQSFCVLTFVTNQQKKNTKLKISKWEDKCENISVTISFFHPTTLHFIFNKGIFCFSWNAIFVWKLMLCVVFFCLCCTTPKKHKKEHPNIKPNTQHVQHIQHSHSHNIQHSQPVPTLSTLSTTTHNTHTTLTQHSHNTHTTLTQHSQPILKQPREGALFLSQLSFLFCKTAFAKCCILFSLLFFGFVFVLFFFDHKQNTEGRNNKRSVAFFVFLIDLRAQAMRDWTQKNKVSSGRRFLFVCDSASIDFRFSLFATDCVRVCFLIFSLLTSTQDCFAQLHLLPNFCSWGERAHFMIRVDFGWLWGRFCTSYCFRVFFSTTAFTLSITRDLPRLLTGFAVQVTDNTSAKWTKSRKKVTKKAKKMVRIGAVMKKIAKTVTWWCPVAWQISATWPKTKEERKSQKKDKRWNNCAKTLVCWSPKELTKHKHEIVERETNEEKENWPNTEEWSQFEKHTQDEDCLIPNHLLLPKKSVLKHPPKSRKCQPFISRFKIKTKKTSNQNHKKRGKLFASFVIRKKNIKASQKIKQITTLWVTPLSANTTRERPSSQFLNSANTWILLLLIQSRVPELLPLVGFDWWERDGGGMCQSLLESKKEWRSKTDWNCSFITNVQTLSLHFTSLVHF